MAAGAAIQPDDVTLPDQSTPTLGPVQGGAAAPPQQPPAGISAGGQSVQGPPVPGTAPGSTSKGGIDQGAGNQKGEIKTPDVQMQFNNDKLAKAQTTLDVLNAATAKSLNQYMNSWENQHGDIDQRYDQLKNQLGARPSEEEPQTKKEKFAALLEFGLHLTKASAPASTNQGAALENTLSDSVEAYQKAPADKLAQQQQEYDQQSNAIESARQEAQKGIGSPAQAQMASAEIADKESTDTKNQASALKDLAAADETKASAQGPQTYAVDKAGTVHQISRDENGNPVAKPVTGIDGKPFQGRVLGKETGSGVDKGDPAQMRTYKYATQVLGIDKNDAAPILGLKKTGNPTADHASVYKATLSATMGDEDKAKRVADQYVLDNYGAGAISRATAAPVPTNQPPPQALKGLTPGSGQYLDFGAKGKWTLGIDGRPVQVGQGPQTIQ